MGTKSSLTRSLNDTPTTSFIDRHVHLADGMFSEQQSFDCVGLRQLVVHVFFYCFTIETYLENETSPFISLASQSE